MKTFRLISLGILAILVGCTFTACSNEDEMDNGNDLVGWYTFCTTKASDFDVINQAIYSGEVLKSYKNATYIATKELFLENGYYSDSNAKFGRLRFTIESGTNAINIIDGNTLCLYGGSLWPEGKCNDKNDDLVYKLYAGPVFGNMAYYGSPISYYTYQRFENKILVSNGDIYTISSSGLIQDGDTDLWRKYDRNKQY